MQLRNQKLFQCLNMRFKTRTMEIDLLEAIYLTAVSSQQSPKVRTLFHPEASFREVIVKILVGIIIRYC